MYKIIEDPNHKYLRLDPIPSVETVEKYYKEDFYSEKNPAFNDSSFKFNKKINYSLTQDGTEFMIFVNLT